MAGIAHGWVRRFYQGSIDHRGVPGAPGRVVTLLERAGGRTGGAVYAVSADCADAIFARLDHREKGGYARVSLEVELSDTRRVTAATYVATPQNEGYLGPASVEEIAAQVAQSAGPSGPNPEYVFELARALEALGYQDDHVDRIAVELRQKMQESR